MADPQVERLVAIVGCVGICCWVVLSVLYLQYWKKLPGMFKGFCADMGKVHARAVELSWRDIPALFKRSASSAEAAKRRPPLPQRLRARWRAGTAAVAALPGKAVASFQEARASVGVLRSKLRGETNLTFKEKKSVLLSFVAGINFSMMSVVYFCGAIKAIAITVVLLKMRDVITVIMQLIWYTWELFRYWVLQRRQPIPHVNPCTIVSLIPIYSETVEQINITLDSIVDNYVEPHTNIMVLVCDGLPCDIEVSLTETLAYGAVDYVSWKFVPNTLECTYGYIRGVPTVILKKVKNQGKRDTLILAHDIFNAPRANIPPACLSMRSTVRRHIEQLYGVSDFTHMFCTDADSLIVEKSLAYLVETLDRRGAAACCGLVVVDFSEGPYGFWELFQNFQYLYGQYVRRGLDDIIGKVNCLPGCISMFKLDPICCEAIAMYGTLPHPDKLVTTTVQLLGTDRRLTTSILTRSKDVVIVYDTRAKCYTIPPSTLYTYISQRRRWASNTYFNTLCNLIGPNMHWLTRLLATFDMIRLTGVYFRYFNTILFLYYIATTIRDIMVVLPFLCIIFLPLTYFTVLTLFNPFLRSMLHKMAIGWVLNKITSGPISMLALTNLYWNIGSVAWGGNQKEPAPEAAKAEAVDVSAVAAEEELVSSDWEAEEEADWARMHSPTRAEPPAVARLAGVSAVDAAATPDATWVEVVVAPDGSSAPKRPAGYVPPGSGVPAPWLVRSGSGGKLVGQSSLPSGVRPPLFARASGKAGTSDVFVRASAGPAPGGGAAQRRHSVAEYAPSSMDAAKPTAGGKGAAPYVVRVASGGAGGSARAPAQRRHSVAEYAPSSAKRRPSVSEASGGGKGDPESVVRVSAAAGTGGAAGGRARRHSVAEYAPSSAKRRPSGMDLSGKGPMAPMVRGVMGGRARRHSVAEYTPGAGGAGKRRHSVAEYTRSMAEYTPLQELLDADV